MNVREYLKDWMDLHRLEIRPRTIDQYEDLMSRYINPALGEIRMDQLTALDVRHLLATICGQGHTRTAELVYVLVKASLGEAVDLRTVKRPRHTQTSPAPWTDDQMRVYLAACDDHKHGLALSLGLLLGLRRGEICGLRWSDVDFSAGEMHVCNQRVRLANGQLIDAPPKSATSDRIVPIPQPLMARMRQDRQLSGYVCGLTPSGLDAAHRALVRDLDLPKMPLHGLRHSFATSALRHGANMRGLQAVLGHATYAVTANRYTHPDRAMIAATVDTLTPVWYTGTGSVRWGLDLTLNQGVQGSSP